MQMHLIMKELPSEDGITSNEIKSMLSDMPDNEQLFFLEIEEENGQSHAMGFITETAYESIDYDERKIRELVTKKLFDKDSIYSDCIVTYIGEYEAILYR